MVTITIQEAQATLADLIHRLSPGEEVVITENNQAVAKLLPSPPVPTTNPRELGTMKGTVLYMSPDFDKPLGDFKESME